jgi:truncated hemoglobin YjbI
MINQVLECLDKMCDEVEIDNPIAAQLMDLRNEVSEHVRSKQQDDRQLPLFIHAE